MQARLELVKLYEHRTRDLADAERLCAETIALLETRGAREVFDAPDASQLESFQRRLERIRRKMARLAPE
ncbi:MAG: hypothetical protein HZB26_13370 [Candidatus Hydrogenedentes bacterium]|nr:hypothetical protein [Candidatus Hydrogenedentota bacterium]